MSDTTEPACTKHVDAGVTWDDGPKIYFNETIEPCDKADCPMKNDTEVSLVVETPTGNAEVGSTSTNPSRKELCFSPMRSTE